MRCLPLVLTVSISCAAPPAIDPLPFAASGPTEAPTPEAFGPFPVGVRTVTYADTGRRNEDGSPRTLVTEIWYPATQATRGQPGETYDLKPLFAEDQRAALETAGVPLLRTTAVRDAPTASAHGPFPLVLFSHGHGGIRWQSTYLTVMLASHGYVVAAPDHQGGTLENLASGTKASTASGLENRPLDLIYLMNRFERLKSDDPLFWLMDLEHIGVAGHSFGALTALRVAKLDSRVKAIVPQTPVSADLSWLGLSTTPLTIPVQVQAAHNDQTLEWDEHVEPTWAQLVKPRYLFDLTTGGHFTFSDLCQFDLAHVAQNLTIDIPAADVQALLDDGCGPPAPSADVAQPLINHFAIGFFNAELRGATKARESLTQAGADALTPGVAVITADP